MKFGNLVEIFCYTSFVYVPDSYFDISRVTKGIQLSC